MFSEENEDFLESLSLNVRVQNSHASAEGNKRKKEKETKIRKKKIKVKIKYKKIYNLYNNLPPRQRRQKLDTIKELMSYPSVKVINNSARPGSNHMEVNYKNYK
jgi:hypothetical protein